MNGSILEADRGLEWHRAVAPGGEVGEITSHGLALSRPRRGFESRWGHQPIFVDVFCEGLPSVSIVVVGNVGVTQMLLHRAEITAGPP